MCRLLGWVASTPRSVADLLGPDDLEAFTALSRKHGDGWGVAWHGGHGIDVHTSPDAAVTSGAYADWTRNRTSDLGLVHLRWATLGLPVEQANTHPFTGAGVAFAHNGSVRPPASLDEMLSADQQAAMRGTTDSERYFRAVLTAAQDAPWDTALATVMDRIAAGKDFTSLNCLLATPDTLYAGCRYNPGQEGAEGEDYFHLGYRVTDDAVVVASSGWGRDWQQLGNGELLAVDRTTLATSVVSLAEALPT